MAFTELSAFHNLDNTLKYLVLLRVMEHRRQLPCTTLFVSKTKMNITDERSDQTAIPDTEWKKDSK